MPEVKRQERDVLMPILTHQELMSIWAGLRIMQSILRLDDCEYNVETIKKMEHFEDVEPLTTKQIDHLIDRLGLGPHNVKQRQEALKQAREVLKDNMTTDGKRVNVLRAMVDAFDRWPDNPKKHNTVEGG